MDKYIFEQFITQLDNKDASNFFKYLIINSQEEIDLKNPKANEGNPGYSKQEREKMELLIGVGLEDSFRYFNGDKMSQIFS